MSIPPRMVLLLALILVPVQRQAFLEAQESLTIGWAELDAAGLDADMSRLGILLPKALMKATSFIDVRYMPQQEALAGSSRMFLLDLEKARTAVAEARRARDLTAISIRDPARRALEVRRAQTLLDGTKTALDQLMNKHADDLGGLTVPAAALKLWKGHEEGLLLPPVEVAAIACAENKLDILVYGKIETLGPYLTVDLVLYVAATDEEVWRAVEYTALDDLDGLVKTLERPLATALAGRAFGRAVFTVDPDTAEIMVDGTIHPSNTIILYSQGSYLATVSAAGFRTVSRRFAIVPGTDTGINLQLVPIPTAPVFVESLPSGAALFLDGIPAGTTPIELPGASFPRVLSARMDGFEDLQGVVRPGFEPGRVVLDLQVSDGSD